ncbi:hypothetical protein [Gordonia hydrophobica]|uniref:Integral membrane protein n=1 Tax=Gordonia hydrophobica TaxID=40516 RepID=A0ABZ2U2H4_9ACTN|nr:hypothetical protein [Gordonia hydrophobica]MBM7369053.1 hypothetical protein [Gordonia hydrophobica]
MDIAALILWVITAGGGFVLLAKWLMGGGAKPGTTSRLPAPVVFAHFLVAAVGLVLWIVYLIADVDALAWVSLALLVLLALTGFGMVARWLPSVSRDAGENNPPEKSFPLAVVAAHGVFAVATIVTVVLTAVGIGG